MKVLGCTRSTHLHGHVGGMEVATRKLYEGLAGQGHEVIVVSSSINIDQTEIIKSVDNCVSYNFLPNCAPKAYSTAYHRGVSEFLDMQCQSGHKPDLIHSASAGASGVCKNAHGIPVIATWHGTFLEETIDKMSENVYLKGGRLLPVHVERVLLNKIMPLLVGSDSQQGRFGVQYDGHIAISDYMENVLVSYGLNKDRIATIYNSVDEKFFEIRRLDKEKCQRQLGFEQSDRLVLGLVGRGVPTKGYSFLYSALHSLNQSKYALLIVGDSAPAPEDIDLPIKHIRLNHDEMPIAYRAMDIYVNPTVRLSGFDLTVQESIAAGINTIVSNTSQYLLFHNKYADQLRDQLQIFTAGDPTSLSNAISKVSQSQTQNRRFDEDMPRNKFDCASMIESHLKFFNSFV